jgi:FkbM family methyltransferase
MKEIFDLYEKAYSNEEISGDNLKKMIGKSLEHIVLYGAGSAGCGVLYGFRKIGIKPVTWLDGDSKKWGHDFEELPVQSPEEYSKNAHEDTLIVVCINTDGKSYCKSFDEALQVGGHSAVYKRLYDAGYKKIVDYSTFWRCYDMFDANPYNVPSCADVRCILSQKDDILKAYELLDDQASRDVFKALIYFMLIDREINIPTSPDEERYFAPDLFTIKSDECLVECGTYNGIYIDRFLNYSGGSFEKYIGFDCDPANFDKLKEKVESMPDDLKTKMKISSVALYDKKGVIPFYALGGPGSFAASTGPINVSCDTMDNLLKGEEPTFIRMNIEDSELYALQGASNLIKLNNPILAISNYHKTQNIWKVILMFHSLNPSYKCYMRSYMKHLSLVAYAVPPKRAENNLRG